MAQNVPIWPGSASYGGLDTAPFGFYDNDRCFQDDAEKVADWCAKRLGYPIVEVELQPVNFFTVFEEAITEYSVQVNTHAARDNIMSLLGIPTGSYQLEQTYIAGNDSFIFSLAEEYGTAAGSGGTLTHFTGSLNAVAGKQVYDLTDNNYVSFETGSASSNHFVFRQLIHGASPAIVRYFDPFAGTGFSTQNYLDSFGFGNYSPAVNFLMMPVHYDIIRLQGIEFNDQIRKSSFSFELTGNRLRIFPVPNRDMRIYFKYTLGDATTNTNRLSNKGTISGHSDVSYYNIPYNYINDLGRQWIRYYTLALAKEMLGYVRGKYKTVPIPEDEIELNFSDLIDDARKEKKDLIDNLKLTLDQFSKKSQLERKEAESRYLEGTLKRVPSLIYIG